MINHHEEVFPVNDEDPVYEKFAITIPIDGEEDEDDEVEGISERSLRRSPSDDASQDSDYCTEDFNLLNETDVW
ncbi:unnamed protein product [Rotaria socialis]|nr:unnamed protein product [Rotaria socialis]